MTNLFEDNKNLVHFTIKKYYPTFIHDEDAIQNGMLGLWLASESFDESKGAFSSYAVKYIRNMVGNELCKDTRRVKLEAGVSLDDTVSVDDGDCTLADCIGDEDEHFEELLEADNLQDFLSTIPEKDRLIIIAKLQGDLDVSELAEKFGCSQRYIYHRLKFTKHRFRKFRNQEGC